MAHRQDAEEEAPVEVERILFDFGPELGDPRVERGHRCRVAFADLRAQAFELFQPPSSGLVGLEPLDDLRIGVVSGEGGAEDDSRVVLHFLGERPPRRKLRPGRGGLVSHHERDPGVAQRLDPGGDGQLGHPVQRGHPVGRIAELFG